MNERDECNNQRPLIFRFHIFIKLKSHDGVNFVRGKWSQHKQ